MALLALWPWPSFGQTADDIIEKHLAATGGREALGKLTSRVSTGSITLTSPFGDLAGTIEVYNKAPNKTRTLINLDLSAAGAGQVVSDQRFDGVTGYVTDPVNGNREITGGQLDAMRTASFPTPLLNYRDRGATVTMAGQETLGDKPAYVLVMTPRSGPSVRMFIDTNTLMLVKSVITVNVPQFGGDVEQAIEFSDFRDVDGITVPYATKATNQFQTVTTTASDVKHNVEIDDSSFSKPQGQ